MVQHPTSVSPVALALFSTGFLTLLGGLHELSAIPGMTPYLPDTAPMFGAVLLAVALGDFALGFFMLKRTPQS